MGIFEYILGWCSNRKASIVSDGDWDGILGSAILYKEMKKHEVEIREVDFPLPHIIPGLKLGDCIIVELPPSRGYRIVKENLLVDHHGFVGVKHIFPSGEEVLYEAGRVFPSVAELIASIVGLYASEEWRRILDAVNLIDEGKSREDQFAWMLHSAYLYNIEDAGFRNKIFELLVEDNLKEVLYICRKESANYEKAREHISEILSRSIELGEDLVFTWYFGNVKDERIIFREAMLKLEEKYGLVIVASVKDEKVLRLHLGSIRDSIDSSLVAKKIAEELRRKGFKIAAGGRKNVAGIQVIGVNKPSINEIVESIKSLNKAFP